jgi:hypothetical protein
MIEAPAFRVLSLSAHRVLSRIEIELAHHGGNDNGKLPVTYDDFEKYGIHRHAISPAIREAEALGFLEVTERGRAGNAEFRSPNKFRLTYRPSENVLRDGTHEWRKIETFEQAMKIARSARRIEDASAKTVTTKRKSNGGKRHVSLVETATETDKDSVAETDTTAMVRKPTLLSISRGGGSRSAPTSGAVASEPPYVDVVCTLMRLRGCSYAEAVSMLESIPDAPPASGGPEPGDG